MRLTQLSILVAILLAVSACAGGAAPTSTPDGAAAGPSQNPPPATSTGGPPSAGSVEIPLGTDTGTELKFDPATVTAAAGAHLRVTFENRASVPHNLTFQAPIDVATSMMVAPGTSETVEFTAPAAGKYTFVCTLHPGMAGTLDIEGA